MFLKNNIQRKKPLKPNALNPNLELMNMSFISKYKIKDWNNYLEQINIVLEIGLKKTIIRSNFIYINYRLTVNLIEICKQL